VTRQVSSSIDFTASIGTTAETSEMSVLCARRYRSGDWGTKIISGQIVRASAIDMTFLTPNAFASREQAMTHEF
jgi:hypothetical protein